MTKISIGIDKGSERKLKAMLRKRRKVLTGRSKRREAFKKGANEVKILAKKYAPVESGDLRDSIKVVERGDSTNVETPLDYATKIEYTVKPYMRQAAREGFPRAKKRIESTYKNAR